MSYSPAWPWCCANEGAAQQLLVFLVLAAVAVAGAVNLILQRHPIHSVLSLIVVMVALAGIYLLLAAEFIAAVQMIVYAGAIMVLFLFVIMLLNAGVEEHTEFSHTAYYIGVPLAGFLLVELAYQVGSCHGRIAAASRRRRTLRAASPRCCFTILLFPFELTSLLILIAILGAHRAGQTRWMRQARRPPRRAGGSRRGDAR